MKLEALRADLIKWMAATLITILLSFVGLLVGLTRTISAAPIAPHIAKPSAAASALPEVPRPKLGSSLQLLTIDTSSAYLGTLLAINLLLHVNTTSHGAEKWNHQALTVFIP